MLKALATAYLERGELDRSIHALELAGAFCRSPVRSAPGSTSASPASERSSTDAVGRATLAGR